MCHVKHTHVSYHSQEGVKLHTWMRHATHMHASSHTHTCTILSTCFNQVKHMNASHKPHAHSRDYISGRGSPAWGHEVGTCMQGIPMKAPFMGIPCIHVPTSCEGIYALLPPYIRRGVLFEKWSSLFEGGSDECIHSLRAATMREYHPIHLSLPPPCTPPYTPPYTFYPTFIVATTLYTTLGG